VPSTSPPTARAPVNDSGNAGIYVHCPFCIKKCLYCDFYSTTDLYLCDASSRALKREISLRKTGRLTFDSLYFGGGTPSTLHPDIIEDFLAAIHQSFSLQPDTEITLEANPGTLSPLKLARFHDMGVNRINIGIQSFQPANLDFLGRIHSTHEGYQAFEMARRAGFSNIGIDLIFGLPGQGPDQWRADLACALALEPEHISTYMLTYEQGTPLHAAKRARRIKPLPEKHVAELYGLTVTFLRDHGYDHYEVSNFARQTEPHAISLRSRHNTKYWNFVPYIGLGPSAHSYADGRRSWNVAALDAYISALDQGKRPVRGAEQLDRNQQIIEGLYLGLRQTQGIHLAEFHQRWRIDFCGQYREPLEKLAENKLIQLSDSHCALTLQGMLLLDSVVGLLIADGG